MSDKRGSGKLFFEIEIVEIYLNMKKKIFFAFFIFIPLKVLSADLQGLAESLSTLHSIEKSISEELPFIYNQNLIGGYGAMPSARMAKSGTIALGYSRATPYNLYSLNVQMFKTVELVGNYRVYKGVTEGGFGHLGYGDDTDRTANIKFALYQQTEDLKFIPSLAIGFEDFYGSKRFYSFYACATHQLLNENLELTLGYGIGRIKGFFAGGAFSPFRHTDYKPLQQLSILAEYDANNYKHHEGEHPKGRKVKFPINVGLSLNLFDFLQLKATTLRGKTFSAGATLFYNIGSSKGFLPKTLNPSYYTAPVDVEPLGETREKKELAHELAYAFSKQGLNLYTVYLGELRSQKTLWIKIINTLYREEFQLRDRLQYLLSSLTPSNIDSVIVVVEADGIPTQAYHFRNEDLKKFKEGLLGDHELEILAPLVEVSKGELKQKQQLFHRKKDIWLLTLRPRLITFFGSTTGKIKYSLGFIGGPEGYLFDEVYYKFQIAYNLASSLYNLRGIDIYNVSKLPIVRSDSVHYYQGKHFYFEQAYLQKGFNVGGGWFTRAAAGYFEPAYAGVALEALYYPVLSPLAIGFEAATVLKRNYSGLGLKTWTIQFNEKSIPEKIHFIGVQYFLDLYYEYRPWSVDFKMMVGQFLAKDKGARFEIGRYYPSGTRFSIWYTVTNGNDIVNGKRYYDKGIAFSIPFDFFLKKSSRTMLGYAMSAWLRDVGAQAFTGKKLYETIQKERQNVGFKN